MKGLTSFSQFFSTVFSLTTAPILLMSTPSSADTALTLSFFSTTFCHMTSLISSLSTF